MKNILQAQNQTFILYTHLSNVKFSVSVKLQSHWQLNAMSRLSKWLAMTRARLAHLLF